MKEQKLSFLVCYDYGMGGLWGVVLAHSESEIMDAYPELIVVKGRPKFMSEEYLANLVENPYDLDGASWGLLNVILEDRRTR